MGEQISGRGIRQENVVGKRFIVIYGCEIKRINYNSMHEKGSIKMNKELMFQEIYSVRLIKI
jgi:hypothetical protein